MLGLNQPRVCKKHGPVCRVLDGLGFRIRTTVFRVSDLGFRMKDLGSRMKDLGLMV